MHYSDSILLQYAIFFALCINIHTNKIKQLIINQLLNTSNINISKKIKNSY
jgi:hypothetical protein